MEINDFIVNEVYTNDQLEQAFKHSKMSGMRYSTTTNTLVLISKNTKTNLYKDKWIDNTLHYTGMGKNGDQLLTSQNRRLANSNEDSNLKVYLFEVFNEKEMTFAGQVYLSEPYYMDEEFDEKGNLRKVYKFPIKTIYDNYAPSSTNILRNEEIIEKIVKKETHISPSVIDKKKIKRKSTLSK
ncbi:hypothetical protein MX000_00225 [Streptococcus uberis]|uniref:hypothetical protein n=1 Tax=Streptococcus uberis TaxID=1349 RepID=UPI0027DCF08F|nr:hypothetical protein [Streptococcus uberis]MCK1158605.1 hypothetical protein [Streptococcus uberis]MCK1223247.1 hypothetical protein [Streptococcus uberis]